MYKKSILDHLVRFVVALAVAVSASGAQVGAALAQPNAATSPCIRPTVVNVDSAAWEKYLKCLDDHNLPTPVKSQFSNSWCNPPSVLWMKVPETERTGPVWDQFKACMYGSPKDHLDHLYDPFMTGKLKYETPDNSRPIVILLQGMASHSDGDDKYCLEPEQSLGNVAKELVAVGYVCGQDLIAFSYNGLPRPVDGHYDFPSYDCPATLQKIETSVTRLFDYVRVAKEKWPNRQVQLIGFSLGGVVAMQAMVRSADNPQTYGWFNDKISGVITFDSPLLGFPKPGSKAALAVYGPSEILDNKFRSIDDLRRDDRACFRYSLVSGGSPEATTLGTAPNSSPTRFEENGSRLVEAFGLNWAKWALAKTFANQKPVLERYQKLLQQQLSSTTKIINVINTNSVIQLGDFERYDPRHTGENGLLLCMERHPCHRWDLGLFVLSEAAISLGHDAAPKACWSRREALREAGLISNGRHSCGEMDWPGLDTFERRPPPAVGAGGAGGRPGGPISPPKKQQ